MAMVAADLKSAIQDSGIADAENAVDANKIFGETLQEYLEDNCVVTYGWAGVNETSGAVDPILFFDATPSWAKFLCVPGADLVTWGAALSAVIATAVLEPAEGFDVTPTLFGAVPFVLVASEEDDPGEALLDICDQIIKGVKLMLNPIPMAGKHAAFSGGGIIASIA